MKKYVFISDIHSDIDSLKKIEYLPEFADENVHFVFLGDYIDGFNQDYLGGIKVIDYVKQLCDNQKASAIIGNHDNFLVETANGSRNTFKLWKKNGGRKTWKAWDVKTTYFPEVRKQLIDKYETEIAFLSSLPYTWKNNNIIAVHAGFDWNVPFNEQDKETMTWTRDNYFYNNDHSKYHDNSSNKTIVSGHTPTYFLNGNKECPIEVMKSSEHDIPRYVIDGGCKGGFGNSGLNVLILDEQGNYIRGGKIDSLLSN